MTDADAPAAWSLIVAATLEEVNVHLPALEAAGLLGIAEAEGRCQLYFPDRVPSLPVAGVWEPVPATDWSTAWRARLEPVRVGTITVAPPWLAEPDAVTVVVEPAQAFGTGHHETTAGCLAALQERDLARRSVLDVGCGSGVLAIAAARLGAARVVACDTDPVAVAAARDNAARNHVAVDVVAGVAGGLDERFDVVVANLDTRTLATEAATLAARLRPRGTVIVSGVSVERQREALGVLHDAGLAVLPRVGEEWVVLIGGLAG